VVHGADKDLLAALLALATPASAISLLLTVSVLLVKAVLRCGFLLLALMAVVVRLSLLGWLVALSIGLRVLFAAFAAATTPAALAAPIILRSRRLAL
jgi:hypothetical protein